jgi:peptide deformylase
MVDDPCTLASSRVTIASAWQDEGMSTTGDADTATPTATVTPTAQGKVRPIVTIGDPVLSTPCREVTEFGEELRVLINDMFATMYDAPGVGLAANQIGVDLAVFVIDCPDSENGSLVGHVVNPKLEQLGEDRELELDDEGCLSIPGPYTDVPRLKNMAVTGVDWTGAPVRLEGHGRAARCLQHETDHLAGHLYIDRIPAKQRRRVLAEYEEIRSEAG